MKIRTLLALIVVSLTTAEPLWAQSQTTCLTDTHNQELVKKSGIAFDREAFEQQLQAFAAKKPKHAKISGIVYQIPTVIHVVSENGCSSISKAQVLNGLESVNKDFRRQNFDTVLTRPVFIPHAADTEIEFVLAKLDPNGQPTDGIVRVTSPSANAPFNRDAVKTASPAWPTDKYFNIWLVDKISTEAAGSEEHGYSQFPLPTLPWNTYGAVIVHTHWGKQNQITNSTAVTDGRFATHTIAHCLNLYDLDAAGCVTNNHCAIGDMCPDTPPMSTGGNMNNCSPTLNTCSLDVGPCSPYNFDVPDQIENYMSWSTCRNMFTNDQKNRMRTIIDFTPQLSNLVSAVNFIATGLDPNLNVSNSLKPEPYFCSNSNQVCAGSSVTFTDLSFNGQVQTYNWSFPGGTPATSSAANPVVTYNTPGKYAVELEVGNNNGTKLKTLSNYITVVSVTNQINLNSIHDFNESFESAAFPIHTDANRTWSLQTNSIAVNPLNWQRVITAASDGTAAMRLQNAQIPQGTISTLVTPNFFGTTQHLRFDYAYAKNKSANPTEELRIYVSTNCGQTWGNPIKTMIGNQLVSNGGSTIGGNFIPVASEWQTQYVNLPSGLANANGVIFKIEVKSFGGGNLFLDNFRLTRLVGVSENNSTKEQITISPNPVTTETHLNFTLHKPEAVSYRIMDVTGKTMYESTEANLIAGENSIALTEKLKSAKAGVYFIRVNYGNQIYHSKLVKQ